MTHQKMAFTLKASEWMRLVVVVVNIILQYIANSCAKTSVSIFLHSLLHTVGNYSAHRLCVLPF